MAIKKFQGSTIADIDAQPGLYAWYFRPKDPTAESTRDVLKRLLAEQVGVKTTLSMRYGRRVSVDGTGAVIFGNNGGSIEETIDDVYSESQLLLNDFFLVEEFLFFMRPLYIGVSSDLNERVYRTHYCSLEDAWEPSASVSKLLEIKPDFNVQQVMDQLGLPHSFALEARVLGIRPSELVVAIFPTTHYIESDDAFGGMDHTHRRSLERLLQLMADPVCGRR